MPTPTIALDARCHLGESPVWDERRQELTWVDITAGELRTWSPATGEERRLGFDGELSAVILGEDPGTRIVALDNRLWLEVSGHPSRALIEVESDISENRLNDCRCDPGGRVWAGTMSKVRAEGDAALYRLRSDGGLDQVIAGTTISNGIGWSPDRTRMYFIDSLTYRIDVLDYDLPSGEIANRRPLCTVDPDDGLPDGLAVDGNGGIWVCLFGGGAIRRYGSDGALDLHVELPVTNPTCPTFGGEDLSTIYVTSARHRLSEDQLAREPRAGAVVSVESPVAGMPTNRLPGSWRDAPAAAGKHRRR
jgi:sugar lactone lactonase YvrE